MGYKKTRSRRRLKQISLVVARALSPVGIKLIASIVGTLKKTDLSDEAKREAAVAAGKVSLKLAGIDAKESVIRLVTEYSVAGLQQGADALEDIGNMEDADLVDDDPDDA